MPPNKYFVHHIAQRSTTVAEVNDRQQGEDAPIRAQKRLPLEKAYCAEANSRSKHSAAPGTTDG